MSDLFDEKEVSPENREKLWSYYFDKLSGGIDEGYSLGSMHYDTELVNSLRKNIAEFSAFKETSFKNALEELLTKDGKLTPKSEFLKEAYKVSGDYNSRWLESEYHQTIAIANMAEKWKDFEQNVDLYPNLKLVTVHDARVRPEHKVLDGIIRPFNDPFWDTHTVPLDWGCRCDIEQTDEEPTEIKGGLQLKMEFENNPAKSGKVFNDTAYAVGLSGDEKKEITDNAQRLYEKEVLSKPRKEQFNTIAKFKKGSVSEHLLVQKQDDYKSILQTATEFAKQGQNAEILPVLHRKEFKDFRKVVLPDYSLDKNPDLRVGKQYYDIKEVESLSNSMKNANRAAKQDAIAVIQYDGKDLTEEKMKQQAKRIFGKNNIDTSGKHNYPKDTVYFLHKGKLHKYNRD
ncbi:phage minor head protein [Chryseobacterium sp. KCF3-3]|uniref:phage minor head protein n=1 Tax=Chryseobacterium sp. KCF3-3 TaxID=3231511 RepID=UPI0038B360BA